MLDYSHGRCQLRLGVFFMVLTKRLNLYPCSETRMTLPNKRVLIPDVAVFHPFRTARTSRLTASDCN